MSTASPRIGFLMDQIAGHITNYRNLRAVCDRRADLDARWHEIHYDIPGGRIERLRSRLGPLAPTYALGVGRGLTELRRALDAGPYDAVLTNCSVGALFFRRFDQVPTLVDLDSTPRQIDAMPHYPQGPEFRPVAAAKDRLTRAYFQSSSRIQAWSNWARQSVIDDYDIEPEKVFVNPPGVDLVRWSPRPVRSPCGSSEPFRLLFVGNDVERKGGDLLIEWFAERRPDGVELHVVTKESVGHPSGVVVHNALTANSPELIDLYRSCDLFVMPSRGECFGMATVEALASGVPAVVSDVGGSADIVEDGVTGLIVAAGDRRELAQAIESVIEDPDRRASMAGRARERAEERFDVSRNATRTLDTLLDLAESQPSVDGRQSIGRG